MKNIEKEHVLVAFSINEMNHIQECLPFDSECEARAFVNGFCHGCCFGDNDSYTYVENDCVLSKFDHVANEYIQNIRGKLK